MKRAFQYTLLLFMFAVMMNGCSTEKNTRASRAYHNVTSRYNIYFNGKESLKAGLKRIDQSVEDDYTSILPIYKESYPAAGRAARADMENAIAKGEKLIQLHSITKKPRRRKIRTRSYQQFASRDEFNNWVDDSYILIGQGYFYQHNYPRAIENFSYVVRMFSEEKTKYDAMVWLVRAYTESERYTEASEIMQALQADNKFPRRLEKELAKASADFYFKQKEYSEAIKFLDITIKKSFQRKEKARLQYIIAQLYSETGNQQMATQAFMAVTRFNPPYKMAFNARINAAGMFSGQGDTEKLKKALHKMLRDEKNIEFRDQIYFALANIYYKEGNEAQAIDYYRKSVSVSVDNDHQRALSAVTLADIYFSGRKYRESQAYYDSAMMVIDQAYPNFDALNNRYHSLTRLVDNLVMVEVQDSLQRLAVMPEIERNALIDKWIAEVREREREAELLASRQQMERGFYRANEYRFGMGQADQGGGWYFYNPQTISYGRAQFQQRWGRRKLEDDWRRMNKSAVSDSEMGDFAELIDSTKLVVRISDPMRREYYLQDVPLTDSLMAISHDKIRDGLYNAGKIFKSEFEDYPRSAESFEDLNRRYPVNIYQPDSYYDLYDVYELMGNRNEALKYRDLIVGRFPESKYAKYLLNPNFFNEQQARQDSLNRTYQNTFRDFKSGRYSQVEQQTGLMKKFEPDSLLLAKIDFMEAVAKGAITNMPNFENQLKNYIESYPEGEPTPLAREILTLIQDSTLADYQRLVDMGYLHDEIRNSELAKGDPRENDEFGGKFSYDGDLLHYFVITLPRKTPIDLNRLKFDIASYNLDHYTRFDFEIETENLGSDHTLLMVRSLENKEQGLIYFRAIIRQPQVFRTLKGVDYFNFVVSSANYRQIVAEKSYADYLRFYLKNYSRFIGPDFTEEEGPVESPEELMSRAQREDDLLRERGRFVAVDVQAVSGAFIANIDTTQNFVLAVKDKNLSLRPLLTQFADFNRQEFRIWNLALQIKQAGEYQFVIVAGLPGYIESMSYFRKVIIERTLFRTLGQATYRNFVITGQNLERLLENKDVDTYLEFFRTNYIQQSGQTQTTPGITGSAITTPAGTAVQPPVIPPAGTTVQPPVTPPTETIGPYSGPFSTAMDKAHFFVMVIPSEGVNKGELIDGINRFNAGNFPNLSLTIEELPLDDFRVMVRISGLPDRQVATGYLKTIVADRQVFAPVENVNYRNFLITPENLRMFTERRNIAEYMEFFRQVYLEQ